jgi:hypothetical protein
MIAIPDESMNDNLNENDDNRNEDNDEDDYFNEMRDELIEERLVKDSSINNTEMDEQYYMDLLNIFIKYYNNKFNKKTHFFSGIENADKDTTYQMELFFESIIEYKRLKEILNNDDDNVIIRYYFDETKVEEIRELFKKIDTDEIQMYCLEIENNKIFTPSLLVCLNYVLEKYCERYLELEWSIFNLKNL